MSEPTPENSIALNWLTTGKIICADGRKATALSRLASLFVRNGGGFDQVVWSGTTAHPKYPNIRVGLSPAEAMELQNSFGYLLGLIDGDPAWKDNTAPVVKAAVALIAAHLDKKLSHPKIEIARS